jgi:hypothetical protein
MIRLGIGSGLIMGGRRIFEGGIEGCFGVGMGGSLEGSSFVQVVNSVNRASLYLSTTTEQNVESKRHYISLSLGISLDPVE